MRRHLPATVYNHNVTDRKRVPGIPFRMVEIEFLINGIEIFPLSKSATVNQFIITALYFHTFLLDEIHIEEQVLPAFPIFINLKNRIAVCRVCIEQFLIGADHCILHFFLQPGRIYFSKILPELLWCRHSACKIQFLA